ncbi:MAG: FkbM family methyltransferase [Allgaiera sp.]|jgi:FkbM family methyltransferase|nr:FkbM family methyltransferase [Allgaiera sp.]
MNPFSRRSARKRHNSDQITDEERFIIGKCVRGGDVVFDVGAHHGKWTEAVLAGQSAEVHAFEASRDAYEILKSGLAGKVKLNWNAVTNCNDEMNFHVYRDDARLSSLHRRLSVEDRLLSAGFDAISVPGTTLDSYWEGRSDQIRFVKVDVEGAEYDVLRGADRLLRRGQIDFLQFEYGGTFFDAGISLLNVWSSLRRHGYRVLKIEGRKFTELKSFTERHETYQYTNFLALHERLMGPFLGKGEEIKLEFDLLSQYGIKPRGALHVGGHKGDEIKTYRARGISPVVFIEANPGLAQGLRDRFANQGDVTVIECAASDEEGRATFNITSMDQSSSLLPLKEHAKLYPKIGVSQTIEVRTAKIDTLLIEAGIDPAAFDFIAMDIQGAKLMALRGATGVTEHANALQIEINYAELYEGCPLVSDLDDFLNAQGFIRVLTNTPYSEKWGDALYMRRPLVTCSALGRMGRFGNQLFQYTFLHCYAREHDFNAANPVWPGDEMFEVAPGVDPLPQMPGHVEEVEYDLATSSVANDPEIHPNADFSGFFQFHTRYYKPYKSEILKDFTFKGAYAERVRQIADLFAAQAGPVIPLHLRRGDFGTGIFFVAPEEWYLDWLKRLREEHPSLTLYIASDAPKEVLPAFADYRTLTEADLPPCDLAHGFFTDFAALTLGNHVAISNSSFSFFATLLNGTAKTFMRPSLTERRMISYDPWNAPVLLRDTVAEDAGEEFMSDHAKGRSKYKWRKPFEFFR